MSDINLQHDQKNVLYAPPLFNINTFITKQPGTR